jgi:hypothetical protein
MEMFYQIRRGTELGGHRSSFGVPALVLTCRTNKRPHIGQVSPGSITKQCLFFLYYLGSSIGFIHGTEIMAAGTAE